MDLELLEDVEVVFARLIRTLAWVAVLFLVIGEFKEYFIYERYYILLIFLFFALCRKEAKG